MNEYAIQALSKTNGHDLAEALDWLCLHVSDEELADALPSNREAVIARQKHTAEVQRRIQIIKERNKR